MSLCDNAIASMSSSEKLREKHTWSVPASGSFGKRPQWAMPKGRKQDDGAHASATSLTAAHETFIPTTHRYHLSEKVL